MMRAGGCESLKDDVWSLLIVYGSSFLGHARTAYVAHDHVERPHPRKGNVVLCPAMSQHHACAALMPHRERLWGLLTDDAHDAARLM
jgi:hypothetical protein